MNRFASDVADLELADYQRTVRLVLRHPLITSVYPDERALLRVRRYAAALRQDLADAFGYRLELHGSTARLVRARDDLDSSQPATARTGRTFDRQRYAYLMLCLAALGRAGLQVALSELAEWVAADAARVPGLGLDTDRGADRRALVDAIAWLEERGALRTADGSATSWVSDPGAGEALYDIARDIVFALYRPTRMVQAIPTVTALLDRSTAASDNETRRQAAQLARRSVVERPVTYFTDVDAAVANHLRGVALAEDLQRLTGLRVERRAEGVLLVDTAGFSVERFPGTGSIAQIAVLLIVEVADRILDPDGRRVRRISAATVADRRGALAARIDRGLPSGSLVTLDWTDDGSEQSADTDVDDQNVGGTDDRLPFLAESFLRTAVRGLVDRYGATLGAEWRSDPDRLCSAAIDLLARFGCVIVVPGGVLVLPLAGRYRNTVAERRSRRQAPTLFGPARGEHR